MAYCEDDDLKLGSMPIADVIDINRYIQDASEEIDICLGVKWKTPIVLTLDDHPEQRPLSLLLKVINANIASGRIILAATLSTEDDTLHAYGWSLIKSGQAMLESLESGRYDYPGLEPIGDRDTVYVGGPTVANQDSASGVDRFYEAVAPDGLFPQRTLLPGYGFPSRTPWL